MPAMTEEEKVERLRSLRRKIEQMNRRPLSPRATPLAAGTVESAPGSVAAASAATRADRATARTAPVVFSRAHPHVLVVRPLGPPPAPLPGTPVALEQAVPGREHRGPDGAPFYLIESSLAGNRSVAAVPTQLDEVLPVLLAEGPSGETTGQPIPEAVCFLDLETTGLSTSPVFLIGMLLVRRGELVCRQLFARSYAEERNILRDYAETAAETDMLLSFNGKSFDVPYLRARAAATRVRLPEVARHLDLLHVARRRYRGRLPDCRLQTLERHVCGRQRGPDVPGSEIPQVYHDFVRTGDARRIAVVLSHNRHDLVTLAELVVRLGSGLEPPEL